MEMHQRSGRHIACALTDHPAVAAVYYPGLPGDRQPELTRTQLRGTSGLLSFELKKPGRDPAYTFCNHLKYFGIGCSWGGFESLCIPSGAPEKSVGGTGSGYRMMVRLHIGLESADDLWADIESALDAVR